MDVAATIRRDSASMHSHWSLLRSESNTSCVTNWLKGITCPNHKICSVYRTTHSSQKVKAPGAMASSRMPSEVDGLALFSLVAVAGSQIYRDARAGRTHSADAQPTSVRFLLTLVVQKFSRNGFIREARAYSSSLKTIRLSNRLLTSRHELIERQERRRIFFRCSRQE